MLICIYSGFHLALTLAELLSAGSLLLSPIDEICGGVEGIGQLTCLENTSLIYGLMLAMTGIQFGSNLLVLAALRRTFGVFLEAKEAAERKHLSIC